MNEVLKKLQGFDLAKFQEELGKLGFKVPVSYTHLDVYKRQSKFGKPGQAPENLTATMSQPGACLLYTSYTNRYTNNLEVELL